MSTRSRSEPGGMSALRGDGAIRGEGRAPTSPAGNIFAEVDARRRAGVSETPTDADDDRSQT